jgi:branched-chain amino acid transport system substrate-binding protein
MSYRTLCRALVVVWAALACGRGTPAVIQIGFLPTTRGEFKGSGDAVMRAAELAVHGINEGGGITLAGGTARVELVTSDLPDVPEEAAAAVQRLVNQGNVVAIVGPSLSDLARPAAAYADQSHVPMITPGASHPDVTADRSYVFRVVAVDEVHGGAMGRFAREGLHAQRAAVLFDVTQAYSRSIAGEFREEFERRHGVVVAFEAYAEGRQDFGSQLTTILLARPDVVYLPNYPGDVRRQVVQARTLGVTATLLGPGSWSMLAPSGYGEAFEGSYFTSVWHHEVDTPASRTFVALYRDRFHADPPTLAAVTYDAFGLLFQALSQATSLSGPDVRDALARVQGYEGVTGSISYVNGGNPVKATAIVQIRDGQAHFYRWIEP